MYMGAWRGRRAGIGIMVSFPARVFLPQNVSIGRVRESQGRRWTFEESQGRSAALKKVPGEKAEPRPAKASPRSKPPSPRTARQELRRPDSAAKHCGFRVVYIYIYIYIFVVEGEVIAKSLQDLLCFIVESL